MVAAIVRLFVLLGMSAVFVLGCAGALQNVPQWTKTRCWVEGSTMFAVGNSNWENPTIRMRDAALQARAALTACREGKIEILAGPGKVTTTQSADGSVAFVQVVDRWVGDDGTEYALAAGPAQSD